MDFKPNKTLQKISLFDDKIPNFSNKKRGDDHEKRNIQLLLNLNTSK